MLVKLFKTSNIEIINECRHFFGTELPSAQLVKRFEKFPAMRFFCDSCLMLDYVRVINFRIIIIIIIFLNPR